MKVLVKPAGEFGLHPKNAGGFHAEVCPAQYEDSARQPR